MAFIPFDAPKLFMNFENPTGMSVQGFAVSGDYGFMLFHTGYCCVYDLLSRCEKPIACFKLGSYSDGGADNRYANHANQAMFGTKYPDTESDFPYMFVTVGNSGDEDENGYIARCAVERISINRDEGERSFSSRTVHTISYKNDGIEKTQFLPPCWGWPAFSVDKDKKLLYIFSAKCRTKRGICDPSDNYYVITVFALPDFSEDGGLTVLTPEDIIDQFISEFDVYFTQGGMFSGGFLYHTFGCRERYPDELRVYDVSEKKCVCRLDMSKSIFGKEELECCSYYRGILLCNTEFGIYSVGYDDTWIDK